jgi:hypothetical protein
LGRWDAAVRRSAAGLLAWCRPSSRRQGDLATLGWAHARWLRDHLLPTLARASWLERQSALLTAGFNPAEQELLFLAREPSADPFAGASDRARSPQRVVVRRTLIEAGQHRL